MPAFSQGTCSDIPLVNIRLVLPIVILNSHLSEHLNVLDCHTYSKTHILEAELVMAEVAK